VFHFISHGMNNWETPLERGLLMAEDTLVTVADFFQLDLNRARLGVLSACETGIIGTDLPDEVINMPTALMHAGLAGVVPPYGLFLTSVRPCFEKVLP
jgi:CHAT domain-containing protein